MCDLVGNPEDRFSHNEAQMGCRVRGSVPLYSKLKYNLSCSLKEYAHKDYLSFQKKWLERLTFSNTFYENRRGRLVDMAMCIFFQCLSMAAASL